MMRTFLTPKHEVRAVCGLCIEDFPQDIWLSWEELDPETLVDCRAPTHCDQCGTMM